MIWSNSSRKEKASKPQRGKTKINPSKESPGTYKPKEDPSWRQKENNSEVSMGDFCAQQSLKSKFGWNLWRGVDIIKSEEIDFLFARLTFILRQQSRY